MTEQPLQRLDDWDDFVASRYREGKSEEEFRNYSVEANPGVAEFYRQNHAYQTVDFARATVEVNASWNNEMVEIIISDDGPGIAPDMLKRIGEPYLSRRRSADEAQSQHGGLGLGVFIARTLQERTGAKVSFTNRVFPDHGAVVHIIWPRDRFEAEETIAEPVT